VSGGPKRSKIYAKDWLKIIKRQKVNYLDNFWDLYDKLPNETARYVPRFLAALHILKDPGKYDLDLGEPETPPQYDAVPFEKQTHLMSIAGMFGIGFKELTELNPELRHNATPDRSYSLKVPKGKGDVVLAGIDELPRWSMPVAATKYHIVKKGENLSLIARRYKTTVTKIMRVNRIHKKHFIKAGQKIAIPVKGGGGGKIAASSGTLGNGGTYRVKRGDSLWLIAQRFNTSTKLLKKLNSLQTTTLQVGQVLKVVQL